MNRTVWLTLVMCLGWAMPSLASEPAQVPPGSSKEFVVEIPAGIDSARSVFLVLSDVRLPKSTGVVLRARLVDDAAERPLGSVGLLAKSADAAGVTEHDVVRIEVSKKLKRWQQEHREVAALRIRVIPYAGASPLPQLDWSVASARLSVSGS